MSATTPTTKTIQQLLAHVNAGELVLPEIQREFVWPKKSVMFLFDSLYRGMPIGHMPVWKVKKLVNPKKFAGDAKSPRVDVSNFYGYLLDGQQRLTALKRVLDRDENYALTFYFYPEAAEDDPLFVWQRPWNEDDPWYVSIADVLSEKFKPLELIENLKGDEYYKEEYAEQILSSANKLQQTLQYRVGITEFETESYGEAAELFIRFNSTGRKLNKSDLAMAELAIRVPGLGGDKIAKAMHK